MKNYYIGYWFTKSYEDEDPWSDEDDWDDEDDWELRYLRDITKFDDNKRELPNIVIESLSDNKEDATNIVLDDIFATGNYARTAFRPQDDNGKPYTDAEIVDYTNFYEIGFITISAKKAKLLKDRLNKII